MNGDTLARKALTNRVDTLKIGGEIAREKAAIAAQASKYWLVSMAERCHLAFAEQGRRIILGSAFAVGFGTVLFDYVLYMNVVGYIKQPILYITVCMMCNGMWVAIYDVDRKNDSTDSPARCVASLIFSTFLIFLAKHFAP